MKGVPRTTIGSATTLLVEGVGEEGDHGSSRRVGRADVQKNENRHEGRLTVPRGLGLFTTRLLSRGETESRTA